MAEWISVKDRLPKADSRVQISYETRYTLSGAKRQVQTYAVYQDGTVNQMNSNWIGNVDDWLGDAGAEYDEEINDYLIPSGWYEVLTGTQGEYFCELNSGEKVTHWMPMPKPPEACHE